MLIVLTSTGTTDSEALAHSIIAAKLAACVQIVPRITSIYVWDGEVQTESESLLLIKTLPEKWEQLEAFLTANHTYDIPEIVAIDSERVGVAYIEWMRNIVDL